MLDSLKPKLVRTVKNCALSLQADRLISKWSGANFIVAVHMVPEVDATDFEKTIRFLDERFTLISLSEFIRRLSTTDKTKPSGFVALTFDDGFRNHYNVAYPILKRLSIPATFYVCSGLVDSGAYIWTWEIGARLGQLSIEARQSLFDKIDVSDPVDLVNCMKKLPVDQRERLQDRIIDLTPGFQFSQFDRELYTLMSWEEILALDEDLITLGSHTRTHIDLPQASDSRLERELLECRRDLEERTSRRVIHFCYPDGLYDPRSLTAVSSHYSSAVTTTPGANRKGTNLYELNRIHIRYDVQSLTWDFAVGALK